MNNRIKQLRLARGLSLEQLAARMGGLVTKQAISKYETGKAKPANVVLVRLADALGVKSITLWAEPHYTIELIAYRKGYGLLKKEQAKVENYVRFALEQRLHLQELQGQADCFNLKIKGYPVKRLEDAEKAAEDLRKQWDIGYDPISSMSAILEDHAIHAESIEANPKFDGISAVATDNAGKVKSAMVVSRKGLSGERQRLNFAHELGHVCLNCASSVDEEKASFRFGAAFLAPRSLVLSDVGNQRSSISPSELMSLKQRYGISLQAFLYRLRDLEVITENYFKQWCITINKRGWKRKEPEELKEEQPQWLPRSVAKALAEGYMNAEEARSLFNISVTETESSSLMKKRTFNKLTKAERTGLLSFQTDSAFDHYKTDDEWKAMQKGDYYEYKRAKPQAR